MTLDTQSETLENDIDIQNFIQRHTLVQIQHIIRVSDKTATKEMKKFLLKCIDKYPKVPVPGEKSGYEKHLEGIREAGGDACKICGSSEIIRTGSCFVCVCGHSSGCS